MNAVDFQALALAWVVCLAALFWRVRPYANASIGLPIAFFFATAFEYIGGFAYAVPGYYHVRADGDRYLVDKDFTSDTVYSGLQLTTIGICSFLAGVTLLRQQRTTKPRPAWLREDAVNSTMVVLSGLTAVGFATMFIRLPIPMIDAFAQVGRNAAIALVCLGATLAMWRNAPHDMLKWFALGSLIPAVYLIGWGFLSYGFLAFTFFSAFYALRLSRVPPTMPRFMGATLIGGYLLLSVFVAYMSFREELRRVLWSDAEIGERISSVFTAFSNAKLLNPFDFSSLDWLVIRLNQSMFVGKMMEYHSAYSHMRLYGESLFLAVLAFVPRFLWPGKPELGGSDFISQHTGMRLSEGATFGTGPVFEFYVNFGIIGVVGGMFAIGLAVAWMDRKAGRALSQGELLAFAKWTTVGLAFVRPLSDFFFLINTALASFLVFWAIDKLFRQRLRSTR